VAADFSGAEVMCPSCNEALRLPKTPEDVQPHSVHPVKLKDADAVDAAKPTKPTKPARGTVHHHDDEPPVLRSMLSSSDGRMKLALALLMPVAVLAAGLLFYPFGETTPRGTAAASSPAVAPGNKPAVETLPAPAPPPPPPVAVNELPPPVEPAPEEVPAPEIAAAEPAPAPPAPEIVETVPEAPAPLPAPVEEPPVAATAEPAAPPPALVEEDLVEAVPATPPPAPPKPAPAVQAETPPAEAPAPAAKTTEPVHTVVRGDTLTDIARRYQVGIATIRKANGLKRDVILLGQKLKIPGGTAPAAQPAATPAAEKTPPPPAAGPRSHTVVRGDTLERIARKYKVEARAIMQANGMKTDVVRLGRKLTIPQP